MPGSESTASPGHAEERSAPVESSVHQHAEGHTSDDDRQGEPAGDHRRCGQIAGLDPVKRHTLAAGMAENARSKRRMVCRQCDEQIGERESAHGESQ
ncbi:MAG: hypothetical protein GEU95_27810 [Rhizobiales bacterium]|nr:hypothetical protein [Hyphomicrobiales bacterium]